MKPRSVHAFVPVVVVLAMIGVYVNARTNSQEPANIDKPAAKSKQPPASPATAAKALADLKPDEGTWEADVTLWPGPSAKPIKSRAVVTARVVLEGMYLEQLFDGTLGPELGNKTWSSRSYTSYNATTNQYEAVRMASSGSPMIVVRGPAAPLGENGLAMELAGEYLISGAKATERDLIRHDGPDKCVIESWMSFAGSPEFKGAEMVLTRITHLANSKTNKPTGDSQMRLGNFSVSLAVKDLGVSRAFYEKLGFRAVFGNAKDFLILQNETCTIGLFQGMFDKNILTFNPGWDRTGATLPEFEDVREIQRRLKEQNVALTSEADESTTGPASITLVDPDGNQILFDQHVPSPRK